MATVVLVVQVLWVRDLAALATMATPTAARPEEDGGLSIKWERGGGGGGGGGAL